ATCATPRHTCAGPPAGCFTAPLPYTDSRGTVLDCGIHIQPLQLRLLAGHDHVDVVTAAQAVVGDGQQAVGVRRKIRAHDFRLLVHYMIEKAGILMAEAVVILPPDVRGKEVVQRSDRLAPGDVTR